MRAVVGFSFLPFFNPKMVYFYPPILPIVYTQVWLQLISNLMWCQFWVFFERLSGHNKGIHLYLPQYCERNSCHNVKIFLLSSGFSGPDCDSHLKGKSKNS